MGIPDYWRGSGGCGGGYRGRGQEMWCLKTLILVGVYCSLFFLFFFVGFTFLAFMVLRGLYT